MLMNVGCVVFRRIIAHVFLFGLIIKFEILLSFPVQQPEVTHFHGSGALTFDSVIDNANGSSVVSCIGVGGYGFPSLFRVRQRTLASWALRKRGPNLASAADAATNLRMVQVM